MWSKIIIWRLTWYCRMASTSLSTSCALVEWYVWTKLARVGVWLKLPGYKMVCTLVMVPQPRREPLGVVEQLLHGEGHLGHLRVLSSKITAPSECGSVQQLLSQWVAHDSLLHPLAPPSCCSPAGLGLLKLIQLIFLPSQVHKLACW